MTVIVTGAAGFIGANLVKALNARGIQDIVAVDNLSRADKVPNLADCEIADYLDKQDFLERIRHDRIRGEVRAVLHQGACSDTMETDGRYMMENNYRYSLELLDWCQARRIPFIYASSASVYGAGSTFRESREFESPLNVYGYSKFLFDQYVRRTLPDHTAPVAGFRYFNVYGPREEHKGRMASVVHHFTRQYGEQGKVRLFEGSGGYAAGEQRRDFISVDDVIKVNLDFLDHPQRSGIFNVGTGRAASFNAVAAATINASRADDGAPALSFDELHRTGAIEYIAFPAGLASRYQSFTQADLGRLRAAGYTAPMAPIEQGVANYVRSLLTAADVNP